MVVVLVYLVLTGSKTPTPNSAEAKKFDEGWAIRKSPIGKG